ncbi:ATP-binding Cassette (ABC) Superfamily, partial [Thraustotheca clavata]
MDSMSKLFSYADTTDKALLFCGTISSMIMGTSQPIHVVFLGDIVNTFSPAQTTSDDEFRSSINRVVIKFVIADAVVFIAGMAQIACWTISSARQAKCLRHAYTSAILRQEIGWFDVNDPMQLATKVADITLIIQQGLGRKIGDTINFATMTIAGLIIAFVYGWELALVTLAISPLIAASGYFMIKTTAKATQNGVEAYAEAGGIAEEALSNIRTVHMFNASENFVNKYTAALTKSQNAGIQKGLVIGSGTGTMFFVIFCAYAHESNDQINHHCTGGGCHYCGRVLTVFFTVVMSAMSLGQDTPGLQTMFAARSAAHDVFELIERQSKIDADADSGLKPSTVRGNIALNNIAFAYPSRPEVQVCAGYSLQIPAGQKIAL